MTANELTSRWKKSAILKISPMVLVIAISCHTLRTAYLRPAISTGRLVNKKGANSMFDFIIGTGSLVLSAILYFVGKSHGIEFI